LRLGCGRHQPFGLRYRSLGLLLRGGCSLREAAPGFRPGSRPTFLCRQESRQRSDPCLLGPRVARSLRPRQTHFVRCAHCVQTNGAKSVVDARLRARRKALCCSARPKGKTNTRHASLRIGAKSSASPCRCEAWTGEVAKQRPYCSWAR